VKRRGAITRGTTAAATAVALAAAVAGCGGSEGDADAATGAYEVTADASFPAHQGLAQQSTMKVNVRNRGDRTIPNVSVTLETAGQGTQSAAFATVTDQPGVASRSRPAWIVDRGPVGGEIASANTWSLGPLAPDRAATFQWDVTSIRSGDYRLRWRVDPGFSSDATAVDAHGRPARGTVDVDVTSTPAQARVVGDGRVERVPAR
jgi:hypothetical protein